MGLLVDAITQLAARGFLPDALSQAFLARGLLAVLVLAPLLGGLSHVVTARRLAFFSAALGHAAITGVALGLLLGEPVEAPTAGLYGTVLIAALALVVVKRRSRLPPDTLVGVFLAFTLGLGVCALVFATRTFNIHQIEGVLFGSLLTVTDTDLNVLVGVAVLVLAGMTWLYNDLMLDSAHDGIARARGVRSDVVEYVFVVLLTLAIVASLKVIGALLVEAFVVVPAATARNVTSSARGVLFVGIAVALLAGVLGLVVSSLSFVPTGGAVVLVGSVLFAASVLLRKR